MTTFDLASELAAAITQDNHHTAELKAAGRRAGSQSGKLTAEELARLELIADHEDATAAAYWDHVAPGADWKRAGDRPVLEAEIRSRRYLGGLDSYWHDLGMLAYDREDILQDAYECALQAARDDEYTPDSVSPFHRPLPISRRHLWRARRWAYVRGRNYALGGLLRGARAEYDGEDIVWAESETATYGEERSARVAATVAAYLHSEAIYDGSDDRMADVDGDDDGDSEAVDTYLEARARRTGQLARLESTAGRAAHKALAMARALMAGYTVADILAEYERITGKGITTATLANWAAQLNHHAAKLGFKAPAPSAGALTGSELVYVSESESYATELAESFQPVPFSTTKRRVVKDAPPVKGELRVSRAAADDPRLLATA